MKKLIKKTAATALSMAGILSVVPSVLCAPLGCNYEEGKIDNYSAMITGKYFDNMEDLYNLTMVKKKNLILDMVCIVNLFIIWLSVFQKAFQRL